MNKKTVREILKNTDYIRTNEAACARIAAQNETLLHLMMEERLLSGSSTEELLNTAIAEERTDLTAELLSYKKRVYPPRPWDIFSLEEEPAAASRAGDAARRRDALLRRIGIGGLRLAAAGRFLLAIAENQTFRQQGFDFSARGQNTSPF